MEAALDKLGKAGKTVFDPVYGARPLKRAVQQQLENPLAQKLLAGEFSAGDVIRVDARDIGSEFGRIKPKIRAAVGTQL